MSSFGVFFVLLVATFLKNGSCVATSEASGLALETSGQLTAPVSLTQKFAQELKAIRTAYPYMSNIAYSAPWRPGVLLAKVSDEQLEQIRIHYGDVTNSPSSDFKILTFATLYNPVALAKELTSKNLVQSAEPDNIIGGSNSIHYNTKTGIYKFSVGWGDCPAGCINNHSWEFYVFRRTKVIFLGESGTPLGGGEAI